MPSMNIVPTPLYTRQSGASNEGAALVLLHGAGASGVVWPDALFNLPGIQTMALDLPGHGQSPPPGRRTVSHYVDAVAGYLGHMASTEFVVAGHSMGGAIALELASRNLPGLRGVVLLGSSNRMPVSSSLFALLSEDYEQAVSLVTHLSFSADAATESRELAANTMRQCGQWITTGDFIACNQYDMTAELPHLPLPILVISGTADRMIPHRFSAATAEALPKARLVSIEGAGHYVMLEAPDAVAGSIAEFIQ
ncbi:MAG: alpha/beta hydrolase [Chloroflexota bacterium]